MLVVQEEKNQLRTIDQVSIIVNLFLQKEQITPFLFVWLRGTLNHELICAQAQINNK